MIRINSASAKREAISLIESIPETGEYVFMLEPFEKCKTTAQRKYAHLCMSVISKKTGETMLDLKERIKDGLEFAYTSGSKRIEAFVDWICKHAPVFEPYRDRMIAMPLKERSSESYTMEEYSQFIDAIYIEADNADVRLPKPRGMEWE